MTESLNQAYSNSPRRQKIQMLGGIVMAVVMAAIMLILYLAISARVISMGRQLQQAKDEIDQLVYLMVNCNNEIAELSRFEIMETKALEMGFRAPYPGEVFYVPVEGYQRQSQVRVVIQQDATPAVINVNLLEYHQTLFEWIGEKLSELFSPFEGI